MQPQPAQPVVPPTILRLHFLLPTLSASKPVNTELESDGGEEVQNPGPVTVTLPIAVLSPKPSLPPSQHVANQKPGPQTELQPAPRTADPQNQTAALTIAIPPASPPASTGPNTVTNQPVVPLQTRPQATALQLLPDRSELPPASPLSKVDLAFTAKLTAKLSSPAPQETPPAHSASESQSDSAPAPSTDPSTVAPQAASQQADTNDSDSPQQGPRTLPKSAPKVQVCGAPQDPAPASSSADQTLPQGVASLVPQPSAAPVSAPHSSPVDAHADPRPTSQPVDSRPPEAALPATSSTARTEPVRDLSLRIGSNPTNQVEVKIQERAGEVHVAVLSSSPALTNDLRQQVGDLVGKLDRAGYHAETSGASSSTSSQQTSNQPSQQNDLSGRQQHQQQQQQEQPRQQSQGRQKRPGQPQWLQEINSNLERTSAEGIENQ